MWKQKVKRVMQEDYQARTRQDNEARCRILARHNLEDASGATALLITAICLALAATAFALVMGLGTRNADAAAQYPNCHAVPVEARIVRDFNWAERNTWNRGFVLERLSDAHEHRTIQFEGSSVSRRYCMAKAHFSNGHHRTVYFMISDIGGFVGRNWDVTHCVLGLDPWRNHDGNCRTMR